MPPVELQAPETITVDDLWRVYIRAQDDEGRWHSISVEEATDKQFDTWVRSRISFSDPFTPWLPQERADFCDFLYQNNALSIVKGERADWEASLRGESHAETR